ncbi:hypothetical protein KFE25_010863 [Diacronema lutheri]|uniref:PLOD1-3-like GT domain-containing protein n=2 Tax=Diacronema lutheri TaxID=2081491 RepID=A0A8J6CAT7_DIALT|nr:hypothetical protein KFE25_010863 [Diacronema lutheri]
MGPASGARLGVAASARHACTVSNALGSAGRAAQPRARARLDAADAVRAPALTAVTVATHDDGYLQPLRESCARGGVDLAVLGFGEAWGGWTWRAALVADHLRTLPPRQLVLVVDAFDVALLAGGEEIVGAFREFGAPIVFGVAERARVDRPFLRLWYGTCRGENINAGGYMGEAAALLRLTELYLASYAGERDDQLAFTRICCETGLFAREHVALDVDGALFYNGARTLRPGTRLGLRLRRNGRWASARTGAAPCVLHAVGGGDMRHHLAAVGLDVSSVAQRNYAIHLLRNEPQRAALFAAAAAAALAGAARLAARLLSGPLVPPYV